MVGSFFSTWRMNFWKVAECVESAPNIGSGIDSPTSPSAARISSEIRSRNSISLPTAIDCMSISTGMKSDPRRPSRIWNRIDVLPLRRSPQNTMSPPTAASWKFFRTISNSASRPKNMARPRTGLPTM